MADLENPFTDFAKQHRPLSGLLAQRVRHLGDRINALSTTEELDEFRRDELAEVITGLTPEVPSLGGIRRARIDPPAWSSSLGSMQRRRFIRRYFAIEIRGDFEILGYWPDKIPGIEPVDSSTWLKSGLELEDPSHYWDIKLASGDHARTNKTWAIYTFLDLTDEERERVADKSLDLVRILEERLDRLRPIVDALGQQTKAFFEGLPALANDRVDAHRKELAVNEAITESLVFPHAWEAAPPQLEAPRQLPKLEPQQTDIQIPAIPRLNAVTFDGLLRIIRVWADAVERYPAAFGQLNEDRISDLLAATLNATLPGAQREVYSRGGKSDIFVRGNILDEGLGPAVIFIAESKWANSDAVVVGAVDPQLFGYLVAHDTDAVLLLLFNQKKFKPARDARMKALREMHGFRSERPSLVSDWPIFRFETDGRFVHVCIASVTLG